VKIAEKAAPADSAKSIPATPAPVGALSVEQKPASRRSRHERSVQRRSELAKQLWSAVGKGDASAEVALARLYITGDGVPRNCEQARVLLRAASRSGNTEAAQQLQQLKKSRCR